LTGGKMAGGYHAIGTTKGAAALVICEGFATGATIHEATGYPVAVAFSAGNLLAVAQSMRAKFSDLPLIVCADNDLTAGNPGLTKATEAARAVGGVVAVPAFGADRREKDTDFNDLAALHGLEAVTRVITGALMGEHQPDTGNAPDTLMEGATNTNEAETIARLAALSPVEYDRTRKAEAEALGIRPATLDKLVIQVRKDEEKTGLDFDDVEPWPHSVNAAELLTEVSATVRRFIICQPETADAVALWACMTWFMDVVQIAPLAVITAPEKRCGKSQLLFLLGRLSYRPLTASNISPAALFRSIDAWKPTLLVDEADAFMRDNEELRGLLNCGHTRDSAYIIRTVGETFTPTRFNVWGAKALAGIGHLADTLMDRAVTLELRRKLSHETIDRLRYAEPGLFDDLAAKLARFAEDQRDEVRRARPALPITLHDRAQDNWEPLLAIADVAGGTWPDLARKAALKLSGVDSPTMSTGTELLADIQEVFEHKKLTKISTADLIAALCDDDEKVWATYNRGRPVSPRQIAKRLADFGIKSKNVRIGCDVPKGFDIEQFQEAFARYLSTPPESPLHPLQTPEASAGTASRVAEHPPRSSMKNASATPEPSPALGCSGVADKNRESGENSTSDTVEVEI
jgi:putative DNA primase/helicase